MDWEHGRLTYYVDGNQIYQDTMHAPLDYAYGGSNEVMGAEILNETNFVTTPTVQLHITKMEYSAPVAPSIVDIVTLDGTSQSCNAAVGVTLQAGSGRDTITVARGGVTVLGGSGSLTFFGGTPASHADGGTGSAVLFGGSGGANVLVSQGTSGSNTTLTGGASGDELFGSAAGNDTLIAAKGRETIVGGGGNPLIFGGGTAGSVIFTGSPTGADSIIGGAGALAVQGLGGNMLVAAGTSASDIRTGDGAALIFGASGAATVNSGTGGMEIVQEVGNLTVNQGGGPTSYAVVKGVAGGSDVLTGFDPLTDRIDLYGSSRPTSRSRRAAAPPCSASRMGPGSTSWASPTWGVISSADAGRAATRGSGVPTPLARSRPHYLAPADGRDWCCKDTGAGKWI